MKISRLAEKLGAREVVGAGEREARTPSWDTRLLSGLDNLLVIRPGHYDALSHLGGCRQRVSCCLVSASRAEEVRALTGRFPGMAFVLVDDVERASRRLSEIFFKGFEDMRIIGVTGTSGKTTVSRLVAHILRRLGDEPAVFGTVGYGWKRKVYPSFMTTPDVWNLHSLCDAARRDGVTAVVMEVSSHALVQGRLDELKLSAAAFTNLSPEHLDFHKTMKAYEEAKTRIFSYLKSGCPGVVNGDDAAGGRMLRRMPGRRPVMFGLRADADYRARSWRCDTRGFEAAVVHQAEVYGVRSNLAGMFNLYNVLTAIAVCGEMGYDLKAVCDAVASFTAVPGRLEQVSPGVFVDYAHKPDALEQVLRTIREIGFKRIITVFGCGGDRDRLKRPVMGEIAGRYSSHVIVTDDNPRSEDPDCIVREIASGIDGEYEVIRNREDAICQALSMKKDNDTAVVIAGKGHEDYQIYADKILRFSDRDVVNKYVCAKC